MNRVRFTSELIEVISLLMAQGVILSEPDKLIIQDFKMVLGIDAIVTVDVTDEEVIIITDVPADDNETILKLRELAAKDGFAFRAVFNTATLKTEVTLKLQNKQSKESKMDNNQNGQAKMSTEEILRSMMARMDDLAKTSETLNAACASAVKSATDASASATAAEKAATEAKAAAADLRAEILKNAEAVKVSDARNSSILAELQQSKNSGNGEKKEEAFWDSTIGQVTMWGGGAVAVGLAGYAAYSYFGPGSSSTQ